MKRIVICVTLASMLCGCAYDRVRREESSATAEFADYLETIRSYAMEEDDPENGAVYSTSATMYQYDREYKVVYIDKSYVSYYARESAYTGGAHGRTKVTVGTIERESGREVTLTDFVALSRFDDLEKALRQAVVEKLGGEDKLLNDVEITDNFYLADDGLHFVYNEYEVASYSAGAIEVVVNPGFLK